MWYLALAPSNSSPIPVPMAVMSAWISVFSRTFGKRAFSTLMILPRMGSIAWNSLLRACLADPPAESPSTMKSSLSAGSRDEQSDSFPGSPEDSSRLLRRVRSRCPGGEPRSRRLHALVDDLARLSWIAGEPLRKKLVEGHFDRRTDLGVAQLGLRLTFELRCPKFHCNDCGEASRTSSPTRFSSFSLSIPRSRAKSLIALVSALRKPSS